MKPPGNSVAWRNGITLCGCADCCRRIPGRAEAIERRRVSVRRQVQTHVLRPLRGVQW